MSELTPEQERRLELEEAWGEGYERARLIYTVKYNEAASRIEELEREKDELERALREAVGEFRWMGELTIAERFRTVLDKGKCARCGHPRSEHHGICGEFQSRCLLCGKQLAPLELCLCKQMGTAP